MEIREGLVVPGLQFFDVDAEDYEVEIVQSRSTSSGLSVSGQIVFIAKFVFRPHAQKQRFAW
jgi:hypothetical protein